MQAVFRKRESENNLEQGGEDGWIYALPRICPRLIGW
jgi:hypothetical protein